jgi:hypothetical protein
LDSILGTALVFRGKLAQTWWQDHWDDMGRNSMVEDEERSWESLSAMIDGKRQDFRQLHRSVDFEAERLVHFPETFDLMR